MKTTYRVAVEWLHNSFILCNELPSLDPSVTENLDMHGHAETEIYQYFLSDCTASDIAFLQKKFSRPYFHLFRSALPICLVRGHVRNQLGLLHDGMQIATSRTGVWRL